MKAFFRFLAAFMLPCAVAQGAGEKDLDTPYVPTPQNVVETMLELARVGPDDFLIDLGSGDGRVVVTAARKYGARGLGVDIDPRLVAASNRLARVQGLGERARFLVQNLFQTDLTRASVITMYLLPDVNLELRPKLLALAPGTRIVSHDFDLGDWRPDRHLKIPAPGKSVGPAKESDVYFWMVPAQVEGTWRGKVGPDGETLVLELRQRYQHVKASGTLAGSPLEVQGASLRGTELRLLGIAGGHQAAISAVVERDTILGTLHRQGRQGEFQVERMPGSARATVDRDR